jgi:RNA polymerase sigma-70 factor, ECF subfamily
MRSSSGHTPSVDPNRANLSQLIAATAGGDAGSFSQLYERTHTHLFGVALRMLTNHHSAEDVLQEAFVRIWKSAGSYQLGLGSSNPDGQAMAWLIAVVRHKTLDVLRTRTRLKEQALPENDAPVSDDFADEQDLETSGYEITNSSPLELLSQSAQAMQVSECMDSLDGSHRQSLALAFYQGLSHSEVAAQMGAPLGSVKAWIRRGLDKLKNCLATGQTA